MTPRRVIRIMLAMALGIIGGALFLEHVGGLVPCELCLLERQPWYAAIALGAGLMVLDRPGLERPAMVAIGVLFLGSAGLALYHVGVERHWIAGPTACTAAPIHATTIEELTAQILATPVVRCDEVQWSLLGISLAGWNALASALMAGLAVRAGVTR
jgi:disulfide bond formation protein DsbB